MVMNSAIDQEDDKPPSLFVLLTKGLFPGFAYFHNVVNLYSVIETQLPKVVSKRRHHHLWASGFGKEDLEFVVEKKQLLITGETKNLHGMPIKFGEFVPLPDSKRYHMGGMVVESKDDGLIHIQIPKKFEIKMSVRIIARRVCSTTRPLLLASHHQHVQRATMSTWLPKTMSQLWKVIPVGGMLEYVGKELVSRGAINLIDRLARRKVYQVRRGKEGITIQVWASGFGHKDLEFVFEKKKLFIKGEKKNMHGMPIKFGEFVPLPDYKRYHMGGMVVESKDGLIQIHIPKK